MKNKIQFSEVAQKHLKIVSYLTISGGLGYVLSKYIVGDVALTAIFGGAINYVIWVIEKELKNEGVLEALKK